MFDGKKANIAWLVCMIVGGAIGAGMGPLTDLGPSSSKLWIPGLLTGLGLGSIVGQVVGLGIEEERIDKRGKTWKEKEDK